MHEANCIINNCSYKLRVPICYAINQNGFLHINMIGKEDVVQSILTRYKQGDVLRVKIGSLRTNRISISFFDYYIDKTNDDGYVNVIFELRHFPCSLKVFDSDISVLEKFRKILSNALAMEDAGLENIKTSLFNYIYKETSIPIIEEWTDHILLELYNRGKINFAQKYYRNPITRDDFPNLYLFNFTEEEIIDIISKGLREGSLTINGKTDIHSSETLKNINSLDSYMNIYSEILANKIKNTIRPIFVPENDLYEKQLQRAFSFTKYHAGIHLYEPQKAVIQSSVKSLRKKNSVYVISETGSGKTAMGINIVLGHMKKQNPVITVMSPGHLVPNWKNEIMRFSVFSDVQIIRSLNDFKKIEYKIANKNRKQPLWIIFSKDSVKNDYERQPAVLYRKVRIGSHRIASFVCPNCSKELYPSNNFLKYNTLNDCCPECGASLWSNVPKNKSEWVKIKDVGWMNKKYLETNKELFVSENTSPPKIYNKKCDTIKAYLEAEDKTDYVETRFVRTYPVARYIYKRYKKKIDYAIFDEVHQLTGRSSCQGKAFAQLSLAAKKTIALTGTLVNGYAQGLFYALYRSFGNKMKEHGYKYDDVKSFEKEYGVYETVNTYKQDEWTLKNKKALTSKTKILPGISPLIFTEFLMDNAVFLSLSSLSDNMPNLEEIPLGVEMDPQIETNYNELKGIVSRELGNSDQDMSFRYGLAEKIIQLLALYPDCFRDNEDIKVKDRLNRTLPISNFNIKNKDFLSNKERELISLVKKKKEAGEKVLVYIHWTNSTDINSRLSKILKKEGLKVSVLTQKVGVFDREEWIKNEISNGLDVLICNPRLVETGLNLLDFTTIVFYQLWRNLFTMRQGSRRSWRLSQSKDISIYYMYYKGTIQEQIVNLMATKLKASLLAEGKFDEEGLVAMSDSMDVLNKLAESVVNDISYSIDENIFGKQLYRKTSKTQSIKQLPVSSCPISSFDKLKKIKANKNDFIENELLYYGI